MGILPPVWLLNCAGLLPLLNELPPLLGAPALPLALCEPDVEIRRFQEVGDSDRVLVMVEPPLCRESGSPSLPASPASSPSLSLPLLMSPL